MALPGNGTHLTAAPSSRALPNRRPGKANLIGTSILNTKLSVGGVHIVLPVTVEAEICRFDGRRGGDTKVPESHFYFALTSW
jgi:hypothetical protein